MHATYQTPPGLAATRTSLIDRIRPAVTGTRDWLDERGRVAWLAAMILGFVAFWPLGLFILGYMIWSKRMFGACHHRRHHHQGRRADMASRHGFSGNTAFDAYREETLRRLEDEHEEFLSFLARLREARDKAEFDQFMQQRRDNPGQTPVQPE